VLVNHTNEPIPAEINSRANRRRQKETLKPGANNVRFLLSRYFRERRPKALDFTVAARGVVLRHDLPVSLRPMRHAAQIRIDGRIDEVKSLDAIRLADHKYVLPPDPTLGWTGPENLSVTAWLGWNEVALYFAAKVTDDVHHAPHELAADFWKSDSIQLAIDPANDSTVGFDDDDHEIGFVLGPSGPRAFTSNPKPARPLACDLVIVRSGTTTTYEVSVPWQSLGMKPPRKGRIMAINFIVNENDGRGRGYWMGLTPGIGSGKSPKHYEEFELVGGR